jgi:peptidoglycan hydrolase-like protein with peptidoglycan-binding domain
MPDGQATTSPAFPGRTIRANEADSQLVSQVQGALLQRGYGPFKDGVFDASMTAIVKLFQAQHSDVDGAPLVVDGEVGRIGWSVLFPQPTVFPATAPSTLMLHALAVAGTQVGQMEVPPGSNRGPMVDEYLDAVGIPPAQGTAADRFWCMAFVYWTFKTAAASLGVPNPLPKTASCAGHWKRAQNIPGAVRITRQAAFANASLIKPGLIAILDFGGGAGHTFIVERMLDSGRIATIEGNTNNDGSNNGVGVFRLDRRKLSDKSIVGFVDYSKA